jgi:hypothetical protein
LASDFLDRWSRRKRAALAAAARPRAPEPPAPALPALDSVTFESDFAAFMHAKVDETVRRAALRKLFAAPHFNVMDGLDIYIDDYSIEAPIAADAVALLEHARTTLLEPPPAEDEPAEPTGDTA